MKTAQQGYSLIELVVVVVVLGILNVIALPKFVDIAKDAKVARTEALAGTMNSQNKVAFSKAVLDRVYKEGDCSYQCGNHPNWDSKMGLFYVDATGLKVYTRFGYPMVKGYSTTNSVVFDNYLDFIGIDRSDYQVEYKSDTGKFAFIHKDYQHKKENILDGSFGCHVEYKEPNTINRTAPPVAKSYTLDC